MLSSPASPPATTIAIPASARLAWGIRARLTLGMLGLGRLGLGMPGSRRVRARPWAPWRGGPRRGAVGCRLAATLRPPGEPPGDAAAVALGAPGDHPAAVVLAAGRRLAGPRLRVLPVAGQRRDAARIRRPGGVTPLGLVLRVVPAGVGLVPGTAPAG